MRAKRKTGLVETTPAEVDPDDAPFLTAEMLDEAEFFEGNHFIKRGRGRPKAINTKEAVNLRLDADVLSALRANGPGWQTRVNDILRGALGLSPG